MAAIKKILVPTDFSKFSDNALKQAVEMAKQNKARIFLFHVINPFYVSSNIRLYAGDFLVDPTIVMDLEQKSMQYAQDMIQKQIRKVVKSSDVGIVYDVRKGNPYQEILKEEKDKKIDLIVIATHGQTGLKDYLLGSVADKVSRNAKCSVFLVRGK
jgi:nucleotide-binding universal stress UspA family protein